MQRQDGAQSRGSGAKSQDPGPSISHFVYMEATATPHLLVLRALILDTPREPPLARLVALEDTRVLRILDRIRDHRALFRERAQDDAVTGAREHRE